jgi:hypothetical protein
VGIQATPIVQRMNEFYRPNSRKVSTWCGKTAFGESIVAGKAANCD